MLRKLLKNIPQGKFFWKKTPKKTPLQQMELVTESAPNLSHLIKRMLEQNGSKPKLLGPKLERDSNKLTVVLELDEVLIYTFTPDQDGYLLAPIRPFDFYREMPQYGALMSIYKRKNLDNFLKYLSEECEPVIWTCGVPRYANLIMELIDPQKKIKRILTQQHCDHIFVEEQNIDEFLKDLNLLGRDPSRILYLDSKPLSYWMHPDNCLPLEQFRADQTMQNQDLNLLIAQIQKLRKCSDVRDQLFKRFNIRSVLEQSKLL